MPFLSPLGTLSCLLVALAAPVASAPRVEVFADAMQCDFMAWASFEAKASIPVRAGTASDAKLLGYLPIWSPEQEEFPNVEFDVVAARPGLKINPIADPVGLGANGRARLSLTVPWEMGWIEAEAAQVGIHSAIVYARPVADSAVIVDPDDDWLQDMATLKAIRGCAGP